MDVWNLLEQLDEWEVTLTRSRYCPGEMPTYNIEILLRNDKYCRACRGVWVEMTGADLTELVTQATAEAKRLQREDTPTP